MLSPPATDFACSVIAVTTTPGLIVFDRIPCEATSDATTFEKVWMAAFDEAYMAVPTTPSFDDTDEINTSDPCLATILFFNNCWHRRTLELKLVSNTARIFSSVRNFIGRYSTTPALNTTPLYGFATSFFRSSFFVRSATITSCDPASI